MLYLILQFVSKNNYNYLVTRVIKEAVYNYVFLKVDLV